MNTMERSVLNKEKEEMESMGSDSSRFIGVPGLDLRLATCFVCSALALVVGCGPNDREINAFVHHWEASVSGTDYVVQPPDVIEFSSPHAPEIEGDVQEVRHDGKVTLRLVGQVKVAGLTPIEIARKVESLLSKYYVNPTVSVKLVSKESKRIFVFGQVQKAGPFPYTGRDTVLNVLAKAQPTFLAWTSQIKVVHPSHDGSKRHTVTVDADKMLQQGDLEKNFLLQEGDIIYVPPTPLAWVGLRVQELLFPVQPVAQTITTPGMTRTSVMRDYD